MLGGGVEPGGVVGAAARQVRRDHRDLQPVQGFEFLLGSPHGRAHADEFFVAADQFGDDELVEDLESGGGIEGLLRLDSELQPVGPALQPVHPSPRPTDEPDAVVGDEVVDVAFQGGVGVEGEVQRDEELGVGAEQVAVGVVVLDAAQPVVGEVDGATVGRDDVVAARLEAPHVGGEPQGVFVAVRFGVGGEHQGHAGLVEQDRVGLVDEHHLAAGPGAVPGPGGEAVAEQVETGLGHRGVGDVGGVGGLPGGEVLVGLHGRAGQSEAAVQRTHPVGVAGREVVVGGQHVDVAPLQGPAGGGHRTHEGLALPGRQFDGAPSQQGGGGQVLVGEGVEPHLPPRHLTCGRQETGQFGVAGCVEGCRGLGRVLRHGVHHPLEAFEAFVVGGTPHGLAQTIGNGCEGQDDSWVGCHPA